MLVLTFHGRFSAASYGMKHLTSQKVSGWQLAAVFGRVWNEQGYLPVVNLLSADMTD